MRILIVDDDPVSRRLLENALKRRGYNNLVFAEDGIQANNVLKNGDKPDLLILDWMMPGLSGLDLCKQVRERNDSGYTYIILVTAKDEYRDFVDGLAAGADEYLTKPICNEELYLRIQSGERIIKSHRELQKVSQRLLSSETDAASRIYHTIKEPLNGIFKMLSLIQESNLSDFQRENVEIAKEYAKMLEKLIKNQQNEDQDSTNLDLS